MHLDAVFHEHLVQFAPAGLVIHHQDQRLVAQLTEVNPVHAPAQRQRLALTQADSPGGRPEIIHAKPGLRLDRVKSKLPAHPRDQCFHKILQRSRQGPGGETALIVHAQKALPVVRRQRGGDSTDARASLRWRDVPPALLFGGQLLVELSEDLVLKTPPFARVQLEFFALLRAQTGMDKKAERTLCKFLEPAD